MLIFVIFTNCLFSYILTHCGCVIEEWTLRINKILPAMCSIHFHKGSCILLVSLSLSNIARQHQHIILRLDRTVLFSGTCKLRDIIPQYWRLIHIRCSMKKQLTKWDYFFWFIGHDDTFDIHAYSQVHSPPTVIFWLGLRTHSFGPINGIGRCEHGTGLICLLPLGTV
jgi:hypothetical protein